MICGTMPKRKERTFWRMEMQAAKRAMELYPIGSDEREIYRVKLNAAIEHTTTCLKRFTESNLS